jgi:hypothetical protein
MTQLLRRLGSNLVLRLNQEIVHDFVFLFLPPCGPHLTPSTTNPSNQTYLSAPHLEAHWHGLSVLVLHLHQHQSSRNLHLQYLTKIQSAPRCQTLITQGSDHPPVLEPHRISHASFTKNKEHVLTRKIGKSRVRLDRKVRSGPYGCLTGVSCS